MRIALTQHMIDKGLKINPDKHREEFVDSSFPNLILEIRSTSSVGTWYLRYRNESKKTQTQRLGNASNLSLIDARKKAKALQAEIAQGADPKVEQKVKANVLTFSDFFEAHYLPYVQQRKRSWKRDEELYRLRVKEVFGDRKLDAISRAHIQSLQTYLAKQPIAPATQDLVLRFLKHAFNLAIDWELLSGKNPASRVPLRNVDNRVNHSLDSESFSRLLHVLHTDPARNVCNAALLSLSSGCRLGEALWARWEAVSIENRQWFISSEVAKGKRSKILPLSNSAVALLESLPTRGRSEWLFVGRSGQRLTTTTRVWNRIRKKASLPHYRYHDLRHEFGTMLARAGRSGLEIMNLLSHKSPITTQRYIHLNSSDLLEATNSASTIIMAAMPIVAKEVEVAT